MCEEFTLTVAAPLSTQKAAGIFMHGRVKLGQLGQF